MDSKDYAFNLKFGGAFRSTLTCLRLAEVTSVMALAGLFLSTTACSLGYTPSTTKQERVVGERLQTIALPDRDTGEMSHIALYDKTTHMIHQFDLTDMQYDRGLQVESPEQEHAILFHSDGNYVIDFSEKTISIFDSSGSRQRNPIRMPGQPISAAFRPRLGDLAIYDSTGAVGLLKLDTDGHVTASAVFGSAVAASSGGTSNTVDLTLVAADLTDAGRFVVALSDNSISVFDFESSVRATASQTWTPLDHFTTTLSNITWVAPVRGLPNLVLVKDDYGMNLVNIQTHLVVLTLSHTKYQDLTVLSKSVDPHFIAGDNSGKAIIMGYVDPGTATDGSTATIKTRMMNLDPTEVVASRLNQQTNNLIITVQHRHESTYDRPAGTLNSQDVIQYRFTDLLSLGHHEYSNRPVIKLLEGRAFALYPSALGHATTCDLRGENERSIDNFNVGR